MDRFFITIQIIKNTIMKELKTIRITNIADLKVGMFDLGNGMFTTEKPPRTIVRSVVAAIIPEEKRALGLCPSYKMLPWCYTAIGAITQQFAYGKEACKYIKQYIADKDVTLPALDFCLNYSNIKVAAEEAFLPSQTELRLIYLSENKWRGPLEKLDIRIFDNTLLSSSINSSYFVWVQGLKNVISRADYQCRAYGVCPVVEINLS